MLVFGIVTAILTFSSFGFTVAMSTKDDHTIHKSVFLVDSLVLVIATVLAFVASGFGCATSACCCTCCCLCCEDQNSAPQGGTVIANYNVPGGQQAPVIGGQQVRVVGQQGQQPGMAYSHQHQF